MPISNDVNLGCAGICYNAAGPVTPTEPCDTKTACTGAGETCMGGAGAVAGGEQHRAPRACDRIRERRAPRACSDDGDAIEGHG